MNRPGQLLGCLKRGIEYWCVLRQSRWMKFSLLYLWMFLLRYMKPSAAYSVSSVLRSPVVQCTWERKRCSNAISACLPLFFTFFTAIILLLFLPSTLCCFVPLLYLDFFLLFSSSISVSPLPAYQQPDFKTKLVSILSVNRPVAFSQTQSSGRLYILQQRFSRSCFCLPASILPVQAFHMLPVPWRLASRSMRHYSCSDNELPFGIKEKALYFGRRFQI